MIEQLAQQIRAAFLRGERFHLPALSGPLLCFLSASFPLPFCFLYGLPHHIEARLLASLTATN